MPSTIFQASLVCRARSARQVPSSALHHVSPTQRSSGLAYGKPLSSTLGVAASWPSCTNRPASSSQQVRTHRAAATPCWAARASARSAPFVRRALCPHSIASGVRHRFLPSSVSQANLVGPARSVRQVLSASHHLVSPTLPSSGLPKGSRSRLTLGKCKTWPSCIGRLAVPPHWVRPPSAAATPYWAARPSARSAPSQRRAQMPLASAVAGKKRSLFAEVFKAITACPSRSAGQVVSSSRHHVSPTRRSSGQPTARPWSAA